MQTFRSKPNCEIPNPILSQSEVFLIDLDGVFLGVFGKVLLMYTKIKMCHNGERERLFASETRKTLSNKHWSNWEPHLFRFHYFGSFEMKSKFISITTFISAKRIQDDDDDEQQRQQFLIRYAQHIWLKMNCTFLELLQLLHTFYIHVFVYRIK